MDVIGSIKTKKSGENKYIVKVIDMYDCRAAFKAIEIKKLEVMRGFFTYFDKKI